MQRRVFGFIRLVSVLAFGGAAAHAGTFYSSLSAFTAALNSPFYLETFDGLPFHGAGSGGPYDFSSNGFSYTASAPGSYFYNTGSPSDVWLSTNNPVSILLTFTSGNITAVGGYFFPQNSGGSVVPGQITLTFSDGGTTTLTNPTATTFTGYISSTVLTSLLEARSSGTFATANDLYVGSAPEPSAFLLTAAGMLAAFTRLRRERVRTARLRSEPRP